jgi:hypothetical protein
MRRWWNGTAPPNRLALVGILCAVIACYSVYAGAGVALALIAVLTVWDAGCLLVAEAPSYPLWTPVSRLSRCVKSYVDLVYSIRYGRGQTMMRISVLSLVVILAVTAAVWTVTA